MILIGIFKQQQNQIWRLGLRTTTLSSTTNFIRLFSHDQFVQKEKVLLSARLPVLINQPYRTRKLKFSFGYTNYGHRRHIRPPGHHVAHYLQFFLMIIGAYGIFYLTLVSNL